MKGLTMDYQLTLRPIMDRARSLYPQKEIVTKVGAEYHRYTYSDFHERTGRVANVLARMGIKPGDRVGTLAWNSYRHLELYFAVPCMGAVLHTLNLRLPASQLGYIINHAEDKVIFVDQDLLPILEGISAELNTVGNFIVMGDGPLPETSLPNVLNYEDLIAAEAPDHAWPQLDENDAAGLCYTSGTTGNPKGVLYSHRAIYLHTMAECMTDSFGLSESDVVMPVVPMFHAMAWGMPFSATMMGCKQVFPGAHLKPADLASLIEDERVTLAAGVPTLWLGLLSLLEKERYDISSLRAMPVGGAAAPRSMIEGYQEKFGVSIIHAWGMTELAPLGTVSRPKSHMQDWPESERFEVRAKQGTPVPGVEIRAIDEGGNRIPWDGKAMGELQVRGPWIISGYYDDPRSPDSFMDGWFRTGDVVTIDGEGYMQIVDRTKDLVSSGGEWISSVDLENTLMAHQDVLEAAVIAVPHPKWQERPLALVVPKEATQQPDKDDLYELLQQTFAKWELPDDILFVEDIPKTSVGKFDKKVIRKQYKAYQPPET